MRFTNVAMLAGLLAAAAASTSLLDNEHAHNKRGICFTAVPVTVTVTVHDCESGNPAPSTTIVTSSSGAIPTVSSGESTQSSIEAGPSSTAAAPPPATTQTATVTPITSADFTITTASETKTDMTDTATFTETIASSSAKAPPPPTVTTNGAFIAKATAFPGMVAAGVAALAAFA